MPAALLPFSSTLSLSFRHLSLSLSLSICLSPFYSATRPHPLSLFLFRSPLFSIMHSLFLAILVSLPHFSLSSLSLSPRHSISLSLSSVGEFSSRSLFKSSLACVLPAPSSQTQSPSLGTVVKTLRGDNKTSRILLK